MYSEVAEVSSPDESNALLREGKWDLLGVQTHANAPAVYVLGKRTASVEAQILLEMIDRLDPKRLEEEAMSRVGWGDGEGAMVRSILQVIREQLAS